MPKQTLFKPVNTSADAYSEESSSPAGEETCMVPRANYGGGTEFGKYGKVNYGHNLTGATFMRGAKIQPLDAPDNAELTEEEIFEHLDAFESEGAEDIPAFEEIPKESNLSIPDLVSALQALVPAAANVQTKVEEDVDDVPEVRVRMSGEHLGSFVGKYIEVVIQEDLLILIHDMDSSVYTPPISNNVLTITAEKKSHKVIYSGISFELPTFGIGVQLMIFTNKEKAYGC